MKNSITLRTTSNITFEQHVAQAARFTKANDYTNAVVLMPKVSKNNADFPAEIRLDLKQDTSKGIQLSVKYVQTYLASQDVAAFDVNGEVTTTTQQEVQQSHTYIDYTLTMPLSVSEPLMEQVSPLVPAGITGENRRLHTIGIAAVMDAVAKTTFGGLGQSDYEVITQLD